MSTILWQPKDASLLKELREAANVDISTLALRYSLSKTQIEQLEEGGDSSFYSQKIKLATGRKLLMHFGADVRNLDQLGYEHEAPKLKIPLKSLQVDVKKKGWAKRILIITLILVLTIFAFHTDYFFITNIKLILSNALDKLTVIEQYQAPITFQTSTEAPERIIEKAILHSTNINDTECKWNDQKNHIVGHKPAKPGDYVYIVANSNADICMKDSEGKFQFIKFKSEQSKNFKGSPPFEIYSKNLHSFQIYYQGNLLSLPSANIENIILKEQKYE